MKTFLVAISFLWLTASAWADGGTIAKLAGVVTVNGKAAVEGQAVQAGDKVATANEKSSFVDIRYADGTMIRLKSGAMSVVADGELFKINLTLGMLFSSVTAGEKRGERFTVSTPVAVAGVRGTKFFMQAAPDDAYICVCEGVVWAKKSGLLGRWLGRSVDVKAGQDLHVHPKKKLTDPVESPSMVDMTWMEFNDMGVGR